jgi:ribosomal protein L16 Arg81 hydroxylase
MSLTCIWSMLALATSELPHTIWYQRLSSSRLAEDLASSPEFLARHWQREPLYVPMAMRESAPWLLQMDDLLRLADDGFLSFGASSAFMPPSVKSGDTRSFQFDYSRSGQNLTSKLATTLLTESTWLLSNVHTIHHSVANLTQRLQQSFGLAASTNIYVTPRAFPVAAPLHTDRTDAFIIQAAGTKRWTVFAPAIAQPVWGVHGDGQWAKGGSHLLEEAVGGRSC